MCSVVHHSSPGSLPLTPSACGEATLSLHLRCVPLFSRSRHGAALPRTSVTTPAVAPAIGGQQPDEPHLLPLHPPEHPCPGKPLPHHPEGPPYSGCDPDASLQPDCGLS